MQVIGYADFRYSDLRYQTSPGSEPLRTLTDGAERTSVYFESVNESSITLVTFLPREMASAIQSRIQKERPVRLSGVVKYCARYQFLGNDHLRSPINCSGGAFPCEDGRPREVACSLSEEGGPICEGFHQFDSLIREHTKAHFLEIESEKSAFICLMERQGFAPWVEVQDERRWKDIQFQIDPDANSFTLKSNSTQMNPDYDRLEIRRFSEQSIVFSWDN
jgi:hypothetical protein